MTGSARGPAVSTAAQATITSGTAQTQCPLTYCHFSGCDGWSTRGSLWDPHTSSSRDLDTTTPAEADSGLFCSIWDGD